MGNNSLQPSLVSPLSIDLPSRHRNLGIPQRGRNSVVKHSSRSWQKSNENIYSNSPSLAINKMIKLRRTNTSKGSAANKSWSGSILRCNLTLSFLLSIVAFVIVVFSFLSISRCFVVTGEHFITNNGKSSVSAAALPETQEQILRPSEVHQSHQDKDSQMMIALEQQTREAKNESIPIFNERVEQFLNNKACKSRFFMTSIYDSFLFGERERLGVETLFKAHPDGCLVILSDSMESSSGHKILEPITNLGFRILRITPDYNSLFSNTPALQWYTNIKLGKTNPGTIPLAQNLSNLLRLAALYKYGGIYLDMDFIVMRNFSGLRNSIAAQSMGTKHWTRLNNAVLIFDKGHPVLLKFIEEFAVTFDGSKWGHNGPYLVSRVMTRVEEEKGRLGGGGGGTYNVTVLPPTAFYPVDWIKIPELFSKPDSMGHNKWVQRRFDLINKHSYAVHLWNRQSRGLAIEEGSVIGKLVAERCIICEGIPSSVPPRPRFKKEGER